ncbi:glutaredoxin family protein [Pokkaliibacter sp. CJK22405]|uniref:glutaredoxin family protein n=1 Tax=Pokkaliibacter sp. CJK22405 TaxID=3384615 RepID=UPI0039848274
MHSSSVAQPPGDTRTSGKAVIYRMVMPGHLCPFGLKAKDLLERKGYEVEDHWLTTREETDEFKSREGVKTTPQVYVGQERVGGYDELRRWVGKSVPSDKDTTYAPVIALFGMSALMALAVHWAAFDTLFAWQAFGWFIAIAMCALAIQKLQDIESFSTMFLNYDLLARRVVRYAYVYPFAEALAGVLMLAGIALWLAVPVALVIGGVGAVSVFKAVYIDKRELKCACMGGGTKVPLGFVSLTENLMMVGMALVMGYQLLAG